MPQQSMHARMALVLTVLASVILGCASMQSVSFKLPGNAASQAITKFDFSPVKNTTLDPTCLVGKWEVSNIQQMMYESYLQSQSALQLENIGGHAIYEFDAEGKMTIFFIRLAASLSGEMDGREMRVYQQIDGSAVAQYTFDTKTSRIFLTSFGGDGVLFSLDINDQRLLEGDLPSWRVFTSDLTSGIGKPTSLVEYAQVQVDCSADSMTIQSVDPLPGPTVHLKRTK
jgi:hypothetical protein